MVTGIWHYFTPDNPIHRGRRRLHRADDDADEARFVSDEISRLLVSGAIARPGQVCVPFRTNAQARVLADAVRRRAIPVQMRLEQDLFTRAEIRDVLAFLRLAHNPIDVPALARILDTPPAFARSSAPFARSRCAWRGCPTMPKSLGARPRAQWHGLADESLRRTHGVRGRSGG